ncbi:MAG: 6-bladed beta-propeller [Acidobacteria bacterium]|nr:6-bladed beta-propeller [Acidobacteriota bacterium]
MVQHLLSGTPNPHLRRAAITGLVVAMLTASAIAANVRKELPPPAPPDLLLEGGRKLSYERSFSTEREVKGKPGFWGKLVNFIAGEAETRGLVRPYSIAVDSRGRAIITDPGARGVHIFDFSRNKYKFIERLEKRKDPMLVPQCVALDAQDNIYVTDSEAGKIFVFNADGKYQRAIGSLKGGEGFFKRPTGIAVDSESRRIYVTDTLRNKIYALDFDGRVMQSFGQRGAGVGEFNYPTELHLQGQDLAVVDAMNFRVQFLDRSGVVGNSIGRSGDSSGDMFRPKGIGMDSEGHYYVVDALWGVVQIFDRQGRLLYYFGKRGTGPGDFLLPSGLFIDRDDRVYVVDSMNHRIQVFRYFGLRTKEAAK